MADNGGFVFDGVAINSIGLEYAPDKSETYVYKPAPHTIHQEVFEAHSGGVYYGHSLQPKVFVLRCYYFLNEIADGLMYNIYKTFKIGRKGQLCFDKRPWLYYNVVITDVSTEEMFNHLNGIVTIKATAYDPRGYSNITESDGTDDVKNNSQLLTAAEKASLPANPTGPFTFDTHFHFYNGGTANAKPIVKISGNIPNGTAITNLTTGQSIVLAAYNGSEELNIDCRTGKIYFTGGTPAFLYHRSGFIEIQPSRMTNEIEWDDILLHVPSGGNITNFDVQFNNTFE